MIYSRESTLLYSTRPFGLVVCYVCMHAITCPTCMLCSVYESLERGIFFFFVFFPSLLCHSLASAFSNSFWLQSVDEQVGKGGSAEDESSSSYKASM